jgi:GTP-binding protein
LFDPHLAEKPQVVALNKVDLPEVQARWPAIESELKRREAGKYARPLAISAVAGTNLRQLLYQTAQLLAETPLPEESEAVAVYRVESDPRAFEVKKTDKGWQVIGKRSNGQRDDLLGVRPVS